MRGKAVRHASHGYPPEVVELVDLDTGPPAENEVIVAMEAIAVSLGNLYEIMGLPGFEGPLPAVAGNKCVGHIVETGSGVRGFREGQRVHVTLPGVGTWREYLRVSEQVIYPAPGEGDAVELSLVSGGVLTAYFMLREFVALRQDDWVIQNGANSNCGRYLVQLAKLWGYRTVNLVRRESVMSELESLGADAVLLDGPRLAERVAAASGGADIGLGIDGLAGDATERIASCLSERGTVVCYGLASGDEQCKLSVKSLLFRDIRLAGYYIARSRATRSREEMVRIYADMGRLVVEGTLRAEIAGVYPLAQIREALTHALKQGEARRGKVILVP